MSSAFHGPLPPLRKASRKGKRRDLLGLVTTSAPIVLFELSPEGVILRSEGAGHAALPRPEGASVGRSVFDLYGDSPSVVENIRRALAGEAFVGVSEVKTPSGPVHFQTTYVPIRAADGTLEKVAGVALDVTERVDAESAALLTAEALRALTLRIRDEREDERARVAREVHDVLGQALTALRLEGSWFRRQLRADGAVDRDAILSRLDELDILTQDALHTVQTLVSDLRPLDVHAEGLHAALRRAAAKHRERTGAEVSVEVSPAFEDAEVERLTERQAIDVYRIVQEALTNCARHAEASRVAVRVRVEDGGDGTAVAVVEVTDDGVGIGKVHHREGAVGLVGMSERAQSWGGSLLVGPGADGGTTVLARIPLPPADDAA